MAVGKKVGGFFYVHASATDHLDDALQAALAKAAWLADGVTWNVAKLTPTAVSLLRYQDFDAHAFPALEHAATVDLERETVKTTDYTGRSSPPILHRKELLLSPDDPRIPSFRAVTRLAEDNGLFADTKTIGTRGAWNAKLDEAGLRVEGGALVDVRAATVSVSREKTAILRPGLSTPVSAMLKAGVVRKEFTLFDYGCGHGRDIEILLENGYDAFGWDPAHRPDGPRRAADVVNLGFVVNVIENRLEREETLKNAWSFARRALVVSAMLVYKADVRGQTPHGDGYVTSRSTFQKYFTQEELLSWVSETLGTRAASLGQGIVGVFRDEELEQEVFFEQRSRAAALAERLRIPRRERAARPERPGFAEGIADELQALWNLSLDLGRLPAEADVPPALLAGLASKSASLRRAVSALPDVFDVAGLQSVADARRDDLLVFGALSLFPGSPRFSSLPGGLQRDVKHFFGTHSEFVGQATRLLMKLRDHDAITEAFERSAAEGLATFSAGMLSFQSERLGDMDPLVRIMAGCGSILSPGFAETDAIDMGPLPARMRGYACEDFAMPLPRIASVVSVDLGRASSKSTRLQDALLYGKSRFMTADDPAAARQKAVEEGLRRAGIVNDRNEGPSGTELSKMIARSRGGAAGR